MVDKSYIYIICTVTFVTSCKILYRIIIPQMYIHCKTIFNLYMLYKNQYMILYINLCCISKAVCKTLYKNKSHLQLNRMKLPTFFFIKVKGFIFSRTPNYL